MAPGIRLQAQANRTRCRHHSVRANSIGHDKASRMMLFRLLLLLLLTQGFSDRAVAAVTDLRVMSFNIWVNGGTSLNRCIQAIRDSGADVVGLQECSASTARTIATNLGFFHLGVADVSIVSRYPIVNTIST